MGGEEMDIVFPPPRIQLTHSAARPPQLGEGSLAFESDSIFV